MKSHAGLDLIARKPPIVATHVGGFNHDEGNTLRRYTAEASTYVRPPEIQEYQNRLIDTIRDGSTTIGCLVAPFGYGKTSTAIDIWQASGQANIFSIPPFSCSSIAEMGEAITTGALVQLRDEFPEVGNQIRKAYEEYLRSSAEQLAHEDNEQYGIEFGVALQSIQDKIERGYLSVEASSINFISFLEEVVGIVVSIGYEGLLIIVDEFQQFLGTLNRSVITNFRTLVWGIRTRQNLPLGFLLTMDPDTERNLSERAGDILHRVKQDGLYLKFGEVYDREFPRLLWERYSRTFGFQDISDTVVDRATLEAIGQISERHDLSNGPRTVINAFQRIASRESSGRPPYTPIDLINDFMSGAIRFDGDRNAIASLVTELTSYDYIKRAPSREETIKLIAAFPHGCSDSVAAQYGLGATLSQLEDELKGEILTRLSEGVALIDLQRVGKPQNKLNIILKKYWLQITEEEIVAEQLLPLFAAYLVDPLFPSYTSLRSGWRRVEEEGYALTPLGGYLQIYEGTFFEEFPLRRIAVQVCRNLDQAVDALELEEDVDVSFLFLLVTSDEDLKGSQYHAKHRTYVLTIPVRKQFEQSLPRDIRWIEDYLSPVVLTPGVVLSLLHYIKQQLPEFGGITEAEERRITDAQHKLYNFLATMIFDGTLFDSAPLPVISRGTQAVKETLFAVFRELYPNYQTLMSTPQWESTLSCYINALDETSLLERRGLESRLDQKSSIAKLFGYRNHAGFNSQVKSFGPLLEVVDWSGDMGQIKFSSHPVENTLRRLIAVESGISKESLVQTARLLGYTSLEAHYLLKILEKRGGVQYDATSQSYSPADVLSIEELNQLGQQLLKEIGILKSLLPEDLLQRETTKLQEVLHKLSARDLQAEEAHVRVTQCQASLFNFRSTLDSRLHQVLGDLQNDIYVMLEVFKQELPQASTGLPIDTHINGFQRTLTRKRENAQAKLEQFASRVNESLRRPQRTADLSFEQLEKTMADFIDMQADAVNLKSEGQPIIEEIETHRNWIDLAERIQRIWDYLDVASHVTDVTHLRSKLNKTVAFIAEEFAAVGLAGYRSAYEKFDPNVAELSDELQTAVKLVELYQTSQGLQRSQHLLSVTEEVEEFSHNVQNPYSSLLKHLCAAGSLTLSELRERSALSLEQLALQLLKLESKGQIVTRVTVQRTSGFTTSQD